MSTENEMEVGEAAKEAFARKLEEQRKSNEDAERDLAERLATPVAEGEARRMAAEIGMREARLLLAREQVLGHLNEVDQQLAMCRCARAELDCRLTVPAKEEASA